jgi:hypothetical protein
MAISGNRRVICRSQTEEYNSNMQFRRAAWRLALAAAVICCALFVAGCSCGKSGRDTASIGTFRMGERVQIGPVIYNILEAEWKTALTEGGRAPQNRFLFIRLTMTNSGGETANVPSFELMAENGNRSQEITEQMEGVRDWLGLLRTVRPAGTEQGVVVFDVPIGAYKLIVPDRSDPATERYAQVEIPVQLE